MQLLLAAVVERLFFGTFRPLPPPLRPVNDVVRRFSAASLSLCKLAPVTLGLHPDGGQSLTQHRQQAMNPLISRRLMDPEQLAHHDLQRIGFEIDQDEQQLLLRRLQSATPPAAELPPALATRV